MQSTITTQNNHIVFSNDDVEYWVSDTGQSASLCTNTGQKELLLSAVSFAFAVQGDKVLSSQKIEYHPVDDREGRLKVLFQGAFLWLHCKAMPDHFLFVLEQVQDTGVVAHPITVVGFAQIILKSDAYGGAMPVLQKKDFRIAQVPLHPDTHVSSNPMSNDPNTYAILTTGCRALQFKNVRSALVVCPKGHWLQRLDALATQYGLPSHTIEGLPDKNHPDTDRSYLFIDLTSENVQDVINWAKLGGFKHVMPYHWTWAQNGGSYDIHCGNYGGTLCKLKEVSVNLQTNDLSLGLHTKALLIGSADRILAEQADKLAKESPLILDGGIDEQVMELPFKAQPEQIPEIIQTYEGYLGRQEKFILVDGELMTFKGIRPKKSKIDPRPVIELEKRNPIGFNTQPFSCGNPMGTNAAQIIKSHSDGATIWHVPQFQGDFLPDLKTDLPDHIAQRIAEVRSATNARLVFLDGAEGHQRIFPNIPWQDGWYWWAATQTERRHRAAFADADVLLQSSSTQENIGYYWFTYSRGSSGDYAVIGVEGYLDHWRVGQNRDKRYFHADFPQELGWIGLVSRTNSNKFLNASFPSTTLDEIEYHMNRALGFDLPISLETDQAAISANGAATEILKTIGTWEKLRRTHYFPKTVQRLLRYPDPEFINAYDLYKTQYRLVQKAGKYGLVWQAHWEKVLLPGQVLEFTNPFHQQKLQAKVTALPIYFDFLHAGNISLWPDSISMPVYDPQKPLPPFSFTSVENGFIKAQYATNATGAAPFASDMLTHVNFASFQNLCNHRAIELDVEVKGNGKDAAVAVHLSDVQGRLRQFQFMLDFTGQKRIRFYIPSANDFFDHEPFYGGILALRQFDWSNVAGITVYVKKVPLNMGDVIFKISDIKALKQKYTPLSNPTFILNGKTTEIPVSLHPQHDTLKAAPWEYVALDGLKFTQYDGNHQLLSSGSLSPFKLPVILAGKNTLRYEHTGKNAALVRIVMEDNPIFT